MTATVGRSLRRWALVSLLAAVGVVNAWAAGGSTGTSSGTAAPVAAKSSTAPWLLIGGRMGVAYEYAKPSEFNALIQPFFHSKNSYFPVYSVLALSVTERFAIGDTGFRLTLTQLPTVSGLDQNYAMPRFAFLVGVQTNFGLEGGIGPEIEPVVKPAGSGVTVGPSLVYSVGWRFSFGHVSLPITLMVNPLPPSRHPRAALLAGIDYGFAPKAPKVRRPPFNY